MRITECKTQQSLETALSFLKQLRESTDETFFWDNIHKMFDEGYRGFLGWIDDTPVCYAGIIIRTNMYDKKHVWVDDLVTLESHRSQGIGQKMIQFLEDLAHDNNCQTISLSSGLWRKDTHRFYLDKVEFEQSSYVFRKEI